MALRGRPSFKPTAAHRRQVEECKSGGMSNEEIAMAIGITAPTLEKHFEDELAHGRARKRAEVLRLLYAAARKGNVSAQKQLHQITATQAAAAEWEAAEAPGRRAHAPTSAKLGKKEQAELAARTAGQGSEWGDDLVPGTTH
jgi:DNA-binding CsgD family transcriptional regulator